VQIGGQDYLVPIDAELAREVDVDDETVALDRTIRAMTADEFKSAPKAGVQ